MTKCYVLYVETNSGPPECWFRSTMKELFKIYNWNDDWMTNIILLEVEFNKNVKELTDSFEDLNLEKFPKLDSIPGTIMQCKSCIMFYDHTLSKCTKCGGKIIDIER